MRRGSLRATQEDRRKRPAKLGARLDRVRGRPYLRGVLLALVVGALALTPYGASAETPATGSGIAAKVQSVLLKEALAEAAEDGKGRPYDIRAVRATREVEGYPSVEVYLVAMRGSFHSPCGSGPDIGEQGQGPVGPVVCNPQPVLTIEVLASDTQMSAWGTDSEYPRFSELNRPLKEVGLPVRLCVCKK